MANPLPLTMSLGTTDTAQPQPGSVYTGVTTGTGKWIYVGECSAVTATYTSVGTTSGGTVLFEESDDPASAATASQIESVSASAFTGGAKTAHHVSIAAGMYVRHRINSTITGGGTIYITVKGV